MEIARTVATRSTCPRAGVGAVLTRERRILTTGYNGAPRGVPHCLDVGCPMVDGHCQRATHAEANAIVQGALHGVSLQARRPTARTSRARAARSCSSARASCASSTAMRIRTPSRRCCCAKPALSPSGFSRPGTQPDVNPYVVLAVAVIACATALFTTPYVRRLALNVGMLDATRRAPHARSAQAAHRRHRRLPRLRVRALRRDRLSHQDRAARASRSRARSLGTLHDVIGLIFGGTLILMVGIWDDVMGMAPRAKLVAQAVVAGISMLYGFIIAGPRRIRSIPGQRSICPRGCRSRSRSSGISG